MKKIEFKVPTRREIDDTLQALENIISTYGSASVGDLYDLVGKTTSHEDTLFWWDEESRIRDNTIIGFDKSNGCFRATLPEPEQLKFDTSIREPTLCLAKECVCGEREDDYGSPEDNFKKIAALWSDYMDIQFTPIDVAMMMSLLKIARIKTGTATSDSFVDLAGYAACGAEIATNNESILRR